MVSGEREPIPIWGAILAVIVAILLMAGAMFLYGSSSYEAPEPKMIITFSTPVVSEREVDGTNNTDVIAEVLKLSPKDGIYRWSDLRVSITSEDGTKVVKGVGPAPDDPGNYSTGVQPEVQIWYVDSNGRPDRTDPGDSIKVTSIPEDLQFAHVILKLNGRQSTSFSIPSFA